MRQKHPRYEKQLISGGRVSLFNKDIALKKALFEFVERYNLTKFSKNQLVQKRLKEIKSKSIPINYLFQFSSKQIKSSPFLKNQIPNEEDKFYFVIGYDLLSKRKVYIPGQVVYLRNNFFKREKHLRESNSSGAAAGDNLRKCLINGILEILERDAFVIYYLNSFLGTLIEIPSAGSIYKIYQNLKKYRLELYLFFLQTDIRIFNIMSLIVNRNNAAPYLSCGISSGFDLEKVILKSIEEALQTLYFARWNIIFNNKNVDNDLLNRALYWWVKNRLFIIDGLIRKSNNKIVSFKKLKNYLRKKSNYSQSQLDYLLDELTRRSLDAYYVNITQKYFQKYGFKVVRVIIPKLCHFYLDEKFKMLGNPRLYELLVSLGQKKQFSKEEKLNKLPHWFL